MALARQDVEEAAALSGLDGLWLTLDTVTEFDPVILSTWTFKDRVPLEDLQGALCETADRFTRFKCRLEKGDKSLSDRPRFVPDPDFDIANHVTSVELPQPAGRQEFDKFISDFTSRPWNFARSPWEAVLATNYTDDEGAKSACVMRVYHSISDGQGLVRAALWGSDYRSEVEKLVLKPKPSKKELPPQTWDAKTVEWTKGSLWTVFNTAHFAIMAFLTFFHPTHLTPSNLGQRVGTSVPWENKPPRNRTFNTRDGPRQRNFARSKAVSLSDIKTIQKAFTGNGQALIGHKKLTTQLAGDHVTLKCALISSLTCAILTQLIGRCRQSAQVIISILAEIFHAKRDAIKANQTPFEKMLDSLLPNRVIFCIPMSLRSGGEATAKNVVAMALTYLPKSGVASDPDKRTAQNVYESIHRQKFELTSAKKSRFAPRIARRWLDQLGHIGWLFPWPFASVPGAAWVSDILTTPVMNAIWAMVHGITTNVPGPPVPVKIAGKYEILSWHIAPPQGSAGTLGVGIMSQAGKLTVGVLADDAPGKEQLPRAICEDFEHIFQVYLRLAKEVLKQD